MLLNNKLSFLKEKNIKLSIVFTILIFILHIYPGYFDNKQHKNSIRCKGKIISIDNKYVKNFGIISTGTQIITIDIIEGKYYGKKIQAINELIGKLDLDKKFKKGDTVLTVLSIENNKIINAVAQDYYRLDIEIFLFLLFSLFLVIFAGWTGLKALISFIFSGYLIWKVLIPLFLLGYNPILTSLILLILITSSIIFLVSGINKKSLTAFSGAILGILFTCLLSIIFKNPFNVHGAILPYAETLLYSGYDHIDLSGIFLSSIFIACSGAIMDLSTDIATSLDEVYRADSSISFIYALKSGIRVGRIVVGTMSTTLLLAYTGGYISILMVFVSKNIPIVNIMNMHIFAAEILFTLVGSFGLILVAPFTALTGAFIYTKIS